MIFDTIWLTARKGTCMTSTSSPAAPELLVSRPSSPELRSVLHDQRQPMVPALSRPLQALVQQMRGLPLLNVLDEADLQMLAARARVRRLGRDERIVDQGGTDHALFVLLRGKAYTERVADNGRTVLLDVVVPGCRVGEMCLLDGQPHNANVRCVQPSEVLVLHGSDVLQCLERSPSFGQAFTHAMVRRLRDTNRRVASMALHGVRERVLWRLQESGVRNAAGEWVVSNRITRSELARMIGASREMVCRVMRTLCSEGQIIVRQDRSLVLHITQQV